MTVTAGDCHAFRQVENSHLASRRRGVHSGTVPRRPRIAVAGATYHVTARGNGKARIFVDDHDRFHMLDLFSRVRERYCWEWLAYCLMDNHYHLLVRLAEPNLSEGMRFVQTRYAFRLNRRHERQGRVFGERFHDRRVDGERQLVATAVYTVLNPVRAGIIDRPEAWPWSSYGATIGAVEPPSFFDPTALLELLSTDLERARALYRELVAREERGDSHQEQSPNPGDWHPQGDCHPLFVCC